MTWNESFGMDRTPSYEDILDFIGKGRKLWVELVSYIEQAYKVQPQMEYSKCPAQPGWNIKYKKSGKSLCTLYPMKDYFVALVVIGAKEEIDTETAAEAGIFTPYVSGLYKKTAFSAMGRWLMIEVKQKEVADDVKKLIGIRVKPKSL